MNVPDDKAIPQSFHGVAENIAADGLDNVLYKFQTVGFGAFLFLCGTYAFIGYGFSAELILPLETFAEDELQVIQSKEMRRPKRQKLCDKVCELWEKLEEKLNSEEKELFNELLDAVADENYRRNTEMRTGTCHIIGTQRHEIGISLLFPCKYSCVNLDMFKSISQTE